MLLAVTALLLTALLAGVHLAGILGINPAMRSLDGPTYLAVKTAADREFPRLARPLMLASLAVGIAVLVTGVVVGAPGVTVAAGVSTAALVATLVAILRGDLPINVRMARWPADGLPTDWQAVRTEWERYFAVRVVTTLVAVVALGAAVVLAR